MVHTSNWLWISGGAFLLAVESCNADCESALLDDGSQQVDVWGADWNPAAQQVTFESLINIRPRQNNPSMEILDQTIRERVAMIATQLLGGV